MTEYPTSQEGPQPVASGGGTDDAGHGKAPIAAAEAVRTHAQVPGNEPDGAGAAGSDARPHSEASGLPRPRATADPAAGEGGQVTARTRDGAAARNAADAIDTGADADVLDGEAGAGLSGGGVIPEISSARREGDRLRFVGAATRRIARGIDLDEIVLGLCRATVPTFSDAILVYLRDPPARGRRTPRRPGRFKAPAHRPAPADRRPDRSRERPDRGRPGAHRPDGRRGAARRRRVPRALRRARLQPAAAGRPAG
ncbi:hypothetical protein GCM10020254_33660 [Streptomyces goshikiensis]